MQRGLMTEYEWRMIKRNTKARPDWWGAQCLYPRGVKRLTRSRPLQRWMLLASVCMSVLLMLAVPPTAHEVFEDYCPEAGQISSVRRVSAISYQLPNGVECQKQIFPRSQLMQGKMLLVDERHPLPKDLLPPNTVSIARYAAGMVPVRSLQLCSGYATIDALKALFAQLRAAGVQGLSISQGTVSVSQQRKALVERTRELMKNQTPLQAVYSAKSELEWPGTGSLLQEYAVDIETTDGTELEKSAQGQQLLQLCWRYGFVRESDDQPFRFRYVGKAHATAMTYLDLDFRGYLEWLHAKKCIVVSAGGRPQYVVMCQPVQNGYAAFDLPAGAAVEISMDNTGYALAACTL